MFKEDIAHEAYRLWQERKRLGLPDADDTEKNWEDARYNLEMQEIIHRG